MQEQTFTDPDGTTREYAYDTYGGMLYLRTAETRRNDPGRPYRPIARIGDLRSAAKHATRYADIHAIGKAHAALWADPAEAAEVLARPDAPRVVWKSAH